MRPDVKERARLFIAKARPSIAGQHGHDALFAVACGLVVGFALGEADAMELLHEYNCASCSPAWSEKDLRRKLEHAQRVAQRDPSQVGYLADADRADYTGPKTPAAVPTRKQSSAPAAARGGAPPAQQARTQRTARTPLFTIHRAGEGARPRTARTVRTVSAYSYMQGNKDTDMIGNGKQPSEKSAPVSAPVDNRKCVDKPPAEKAERVDRTLIWSDGEVWKGGKYVGTTLSQKEIREQLKID